MAIVIVKATKEEVRQRAISVYWGTDGWLKQAPSRRRPLFVFSVRRKVIAVILIYLQLSYVTQLNLHTKICS